MSIHPDIAAFLELVAAGVTRGKRKSLHELAVAQARIDFDNSSLVIDHPPQDLPHVEDVTITVRDGATIAGRLYLPLNRATSAPQPLLLYFHGGGYVVGGLDSHDSLCRSLAYRTPCAVLAVDYRRAPEHKFPIAVHDAIDSLQWAFANAATLGIDAGRIAVGGDSAGGTLATVVALSSPESQALAVQLLIYPCTSAYPHFESHRRFAESPMLSATTLRWFYDHYLRSEADRKDWRFAPLEIQKVTRVTPAHIVLGDHDPLVDEGQEYARKLQSFGVPVTVALYAGMPHDFVRLGGIIPDEAARAHDEIAGVLARAFESTRPSP